MKDLQKLYKECIMEAQSVGLDISPRIIGIGINSRLSRALGRCKRTYGHGGNYWFSIEIQPNILSDGISDNIPKNTIMHELIHTYPGAFNHGSCFQARANMINQKLGYNVHTTSSSTQLEAAGVELKKREDKYIIKCDKCGGINGRYKRWSTTLERIGSYRCGGCGGTLSVIDLTGKYAIASCHQK